jgi:arylsulfatase A-like enzyme
MLSIRRGKWKLIEGLGSGGFSKPKKLKPDPGGPEGQLFDLNADLGETVNLYADYPQIVSELSQALKQIVADGRSR